MRVRSSSSQNNISSLFKKHAFHSKTSHSLHSFSDYVFHSLSSRTPLFLGPDFCSPAQVLYQLPARLNASSWACQSAGHAIEDEQHACRHQPVQYEENSLSPPAISLATSLATSLANHQPAAPPHLRSSTYQSLASLCPESAIRPEDNHTSRRRSQQVARIACSCLKGWRGSGLPFGRVDFGIHRQILRKLAFLNFHLVLSAAPLEHRLRLRRRVALPA